MGTCQRHSGVVKQSALGPQLTKTVGKYAPNPVLARPSFHFNVKHSPSTTRVSLPRSVLFARRRVQRDWILDRTCSKTVLRTSARRSERFSPGPDRGECISQ